MLGFCRKCIAEPLVATNYQIFIRFGNIVIHCPNIQECPKCKEAYIMSNSYKCSLECVNRVNCLTLPTAMSNKELTGI